MNRMVGKSQKKMNCLPLARGDESIYKTKDEAREYIAEYILQKEQLPNHQRCIFGVVDKMYHYIGAPGTREDGIRRNQELRQSYPQHPCFQDVKNGITRGQEILLRKK